MAECTQENCTVADTGTCLLNNEPASCPNYKSIDSIIAYDGDIEKLIQPLATPLESTRFPLSYTLSADKMSQMMGQRYCQVIGIVGAPDAGKTAAIVSLYLLAANAKLKGYTYAHSYSLMALNEISQGARRWNEGEIPDQLTLHTELGDERSAGFLHLRLRRLDRDHVVDFFLPDVPGEWTTALIDSARADRLEFLQRSDVIWMMVDGKTLTEHSTRRQATHRTKLLIQRLADLLTDPPPIILVITRHDVSTPPEATISAFKQEGLECGLKISVAFIASFADAGTVEPGFGISELLTASLGGSGEPPCYWPEKTKALENLRSIMRYTYSAEES